MTGGQEITLQLSPADQQGVSLLLLLVERGYDFVTVTPATHATVLAAREGELARDTRDLLGWSMPFDDTFADRELIATLDKAGLVERSGEPSRAKVRVSRLDGRLFLHSAYPTIAQDSVFFGPDSYRFADLILAELPPAHRGSVILDVGTGAGVGAIVAAARRPEARVVGTDINPRALALAAVNAAAAGVSIETRCGDILADFDAPINIALANPPYIVDAGGRAYRDGGAMHGAELSLRMIEAVLPALAPGGRFILYTGSAVVSGRDHLREDAMLLASQVGCTCRYREIDPDVFGDELAQPPYADVERIAAIAAVFDRH